MEFKLFSISQKGFIFKTYLIEDEDELVYTVKSKGFGLFKRFIFQNTMGLEDFEIKRKAKLFKTQFELLNNGIPFAEIKKSGGFKNSKFEIIAEHTYYTARGNMFLNELTVFDGEKEIGKISRKSFRKKHKYGIAMNANADETLVLSMAMVIEWIRNRRKSKSA